MNSPLGMADVEAIVSLLGKIAGMETPIADRRRALMQGLCGLVGCDAGVWVHQRFDGQTGQAALFQAMDGGFATDHDRLDYFQASINPALQDLYAPRFLECVRKKLTHFTWTQQEILAPELTRRPELDSYARSGRYEPAMWSIYLLSDSALSGIGLLRQRGKAPAGNRERTIVHLLLSQVDWLHRAHTDVPANNDDLLDLSGREREVLFLLMGGLARKQIAEKLGISPNTVADHLKSIYRLFGVRTRGQLLSRFIAGSTPKRA